FVPLALASPSSCAVVHVWSGGVEVGIVSSCSPPRPPAGTGGPRLIDVVGRRRGRRRVCRAIRVKEKDNRKKKGLHDLDTEKCKTSLGGPGGHARCKITESQSESLSESLCIYLSVELRPASASPRWSLY